jgi:hypothetical protein
VAAAGRPLRHPIPLNQLPTLTVPVEIQTGAVATPEAVSETAVAETVVPQETENLDADADGIGVGVALLMMERLLEHRQPLREAC